MTSCSRFLLHANLFKLSEVFAFTLSPEIRNFPIFDVLPSQPSPIVRMSSHGQRTLSIFSWGLVPRWSPASKLGSRKITTPAEVVTNPAYFSLLTRNRCLIPADGFYQWQRINQQVAQPHVVSLRSGEPFAFAGLWSSWSVDGAPLETFTILTTESNSLIRPMHDRMPVILPHERYIAWLSPDSDPDELLPLLTPYRADEMQCYPVSESEEAEVCTAAYQRLV